MPQVGSVWTRPPGGSMVGATAAMAETEDEAELVARAKRELAAFAPLYARYFDPVYRYCYRRLGSAEAAADATSQVFAKALSALSGCRGASFRSWLFAIAHNVITDSYRSQRSDRPIEAAADVFDGAPSPEEQAIATEERRSLRALLAQLPPDQRHVVELRLAGLNGTEIAESLGRSRAAVDTAQCRAVVRLRALLGIAGRTKEGRDATE